LAFVLLAGCSKTEATEAPKCKNGIRSQCIDEAAIGSQFGCALLADRTVWCWGRNDQGQLGYNTTDLCPEDIGGGKTRAVACHTFPFQVPGLEGVTRVASGESFSCAILGDGSVRCWGGNSQGELGNGKNVTSQTPVPVDAVSNVTALALGTHHACALTGEGKVVCWGANDHGQLGTTTSTRCKVDNGVEIDCATHAVPLDLSNVVALSAGAQHTCALTGDQKVVCWGDNHWGQLGIGTAGEPAPIDPDHDAGDDTGAPGDDAGSEAAVDAGPPLPNRLSVFVSTTDALTNVVSIAAGAFHTCALRDGGDVLCWGRDDHDELGGPPPATGAMGCPGPCSALATPVPDLPKTIEGPEDAGADTSTEDSATVDGSMDDATVTDDTGSSDDASIDSAIADTGSAIDSGPPQGVFGRVLTSGDSYSCLRVGDGTVRCWGADTVGQLGDGRTTNDPRGVTLVIAAPGAASNNPLQGAARVRAGGSSACAIMSDDSLRCWGTNQNGALGVGHFTPQQGPVPVSW
jgi:alpha-tubulin suppressor-like RCC1 family protein